MEKLKRKSKYAKKERNENEKTTTLNPWDSLKAVLRGRFISIQVYSNK